MTMTQEIENLNEYYYMENLELKIKFKQGLIDKSLFDLYKSQLDRMYNLDLVDIHNGIEVFTE
tara:strand:- start:417 stop:605 length:189 start_codon:yes stop_codon:yes gene_type:complete